MFGQLVAPEKGTLDEQQGGAAALAAMVFVPRASAFRCCSASHN